MSTQQKDQTYYLVKIQPWIEKVAIILLVATGAMMLFSIPADDLLMISLGTLSIAFFLNTRVPVEAEQTESAMGFGALLAYSILPKVTWIGASVCVIGILFHFLGLSGAVNMLLIGGMSLSFSIGILAILFLTGTKGLGIYQPILIRVLPVAAVTGFLLIGIFKS